MSENNRSRAMLDPMELWRKWFEVGAEMWSDVFGGTKGNFVDPYEFYRQWFESMDDAWRKMAGSAGTSQTASPLAQMINNPVMALMNPAAAIPGSSTSETPAGKADATKTAATMGTAEAQNLWRQWFQAVNESWQKAAALGADAVELAPRYAQMLEQIRHNFLSAEGFPTDPLQFATRWYNATNGPLSEFVGDLLEREEILDVSSQFLQNYASFYRVFKRESEERLKALQIPVRSDVARVAGLVVALEDKIDRLDEAFEDFEYGYAEPATNESLQAVEERIERLEQTLVERVEGSTAGAATADSVNSLNERLNNVEDKLDQLLAALQNTSQNGTQPEGSQSEGSGEIRATKAAREKAEELGIDLATVEGTGSNGQITVEDVRREGQS